MGPPGRLLRAQSGTCWEVLPSAPPAAQSTSGAVTSASGMRRSEGGDRVPGERSPGRRGVQRRHVVLECLPPASYFGGI